jgi:transcriptional regulator with XRE-family HTH domain
MPKSVFTKEYERLRKLLVHARHSAGLSQIDLAKKLSRPQSYVSKYERGERRLDVIEFLYISQAIDINPAKILREIAQFGGQKTRGETQ